MDWVCVDKIDSKSPPHVNAIYDYWQTHLKDVISFTEFEKRITAEHAKKHNWSYASWSTIFHTLNYLMTNPYTRHIVTHLILRHYGLV